ncbi:MULTISPECIES: hypothetical protein [unclassified Fibrobacter]|uniref:hypothetical protein n=1 Tax=unclassified Fibrobacter TaxID=2634177 RepID=UPI000D7B461A|nr:MULTISPECIES: hypothetical protein [unclassified Fibrobacter]PWJ69111.1 hypothetical protein BGX12_10575 [Fibrobacter sp. UWR4]PZW72942.1 hypothetical protein C8E88_100575 [Fibrobacter sp. UWR1]
MIRKFLGFSLVIAVLCLVGCSGSSNAEDDCDVDQVTTHCSDGAVDDSDDLVEDSSDL